MNLNRTQRIIARVAAILVFLIQAAGIVQDGLDESRGWVWAFLVSATLLILSFHGPDESRTTQESPPKQDKTRLKEMVKDFKVLMSRALEAVNECTVMADKMYAFVRREQLYHKTGPLAQILDPDVHSVLAAHALVVACLAERRQAEDPLVWSTYTTLINRLAERHANASVEMAQHSGLPEFKEPNQALDPTGHRGPAAVARGSGREARPEPAAAPDSRCTTSGCSAPTGEPRGRSAAHTTARSSRGRSQSLAASTSSQETQCPHRQQHAHHYPTTIGQSPLS